MNNHEINEILDTLAITMNTAEELIIENEGEVTEDYEQLEEQIGLLQELLTTEGIDSLGRWLKAKEDAIKALKAEKDYITRKINAANSSIDYIKSQMHRVLVASGLSEIKGANGYSFKATISKKTEVDKAVLKDMFQANVEKTLRESGIIPNDVTITLGASISAVKEGEEIPQYYTISETPSCTFKKPRAK